MGHERPAVLKKLFPVAIVLALVYLGVDRWHGPNAGSSFPETPGQSDAPQSQQPASREATPRAGTQFESEGTVIRVLPDDTKGSRHQRFLVRLSTGRTVLIAHNIDLAPRVQGLSEGDTVTFSGEFEDNDKGGVVHWTHHDPSGRHVAGWIRHRGQVYQ
jgi:hypothetical protein